MKIITLNVQVKVLSKECIPALIAELQENLYRGNFDGKLTKDDGDQLRWTTKTEK